jgi:hypothetical protein
MLLPSSPESGGFLYPPRQFTPARIRNWIRQNSEVPQIAGLLNSGESGYNHTVFDNLRQST